MKRTGFILAFLLLCSSLAAQQPMFSSQRAGWLEKAERAKPVLAERRVAPVQVVRSVADPDAFQTWRMAPVESATAFIGSPFRDIKEIVLDFGEHVTGHLTFTLAPLKGAQADSPLRLRFTFGEVPAEVNIPFDLHPGGLSRAWLQDEVVTVDVLGEVTIPRRVSFRYVRIELIGAPSHYDFAFTDMYCTATTSATSTPLLLRTGTDPAIEKINQVGLATLRECMQTIYEDGPKRDRRLRIGDLYFATLANAFSCRNHELTKRCLYLLAGLADDQGVVYATVIEKPTPHALRNSYTMDYLLLYGICVQEYLKASGDRETALDLWPVVRRQIEFARTCLDAESVYDADKKPNFWLMFDTRNGYDRSASIQGMMTYAVDQGYELARTLGRESEVSDWPALVRKMKEGGRKRYFDRYLKLVTSGSSKQISYLSQAWMVLSQTLTPQESVHAMGTVLMMADAVPPASPYGWHYVIEALLQCGMPGDARRAMTDYWGGMIKKGADTFWEVYDPRNDRRSPYGFFPMNSYCHAWSCTPVYFIGKYPDVFQK